MLTKLFSPLQSAFVPNRGIHDSILTSHETFTNFSKSRETSGYMAIKLGMKKAYDQLEWSFIVGFSNTWTERIMQCITTTSFNVIVNNNYTIFFPRREVLE